MKKLLVLIVLSVCVFQQAYAKLPVVARSCAQVDSSLADSQKALYEQALAKQFGVSKVDILTSYRYQSWTILYVNTYSSDEQFLFYDADPATAYSLTAWGGAAMTSEEPDIRDWAVTNAKGIPVALAKCFAWHATHTR